MTKSKTYYGKYICQNNYYNVHFRILKRRLDLHRDEWRSAYAERNSANSLETLVPPSSNTSVSPAAPQQKSIKLKINLAKQQASTSKATPSRQATPSTSRAAAKPQPQAKIHGGKPKAVMPIKVVNFRLIFFTYKTQN